MLDIFSWCMCVSEMFGLKVDFTLAAPAEDMSEHTKKEIVVKWYLL